MNLDIKSNSLKGRLLWGIKLALRYNKLIPKNIINSLNRKMVIF